MNLTGKVSHFGGSADSGVSASEDLALYWEDSQVALHPELFVDGASTENGGLARQLRAEAPYLAVRWSYEGYSKDELRDALFVIYAPDTGRSFLCRAVDWGPHEDTDRIADISPGLMDALGIETDSEVTIIGPVRDLDRPLPARPGVPVAFPYPAIVISSGHSTKCQGAVGILNEVDEATRVVDRVAEILRTIGVEVQTFHDTKSTSQNENLNRIVDFHNAQARQLDVSVHFNANVETDSPMGTECLYLTQEALADDIAEAIAANGLKDRGPKYRSDLFFLNNTDEKAILIEVCFVDSSADAKIYKVKFDDICASIANVLSGGGNAPLV